MDKIRVDEWANVARDYMSRQVENALDDLRSHDSSCFSQLELDSIMAISDQWQRYRGLSYEFLDLLFDMWGDHFG